MPNPIDTEAEFIKGFFPDVLPKSEKFDLIVHSHVWEHAYSPYQFIQSIADLLPMKGRMVFSIPNLRYLLEKQMTSVLNFEHTVYLTDVYVEYLLYKFGFEIDRKIFFENHSVMYIATRITESPVSMLQFDIRDYYGINKELFLKYIESHLNRVGKANDDLNDISAKVFMFGGHIATQFYLALGLNTDKIICCIDNDKYKWGKRLGGSDLSVENPGIISKEDSPIVILPSGPYTVEIQKQIINEVNSNTRFIQI